MIFGNSHIYYSSHGNKFNDANTIQISSPMTRRIYFRWRFNNQETQNIILMKLTSWYSNQNWALVRISGHANLFVKKSVNSRFGPLIPNFDTIRKSWNDFCSMSVIFLFHPHWHLKSRPGSNSQSQSFPYISSSFLASVSSNGSIPYHFSLISGIHQYPIPVDISGKSESLPWIKNFK